MPLYYQLKQVLRDKVESDELAPGDMVPSEHELANAFSISRATARRALEDLTSEGLFIRKQGKGTFVSPKKLVQGLSRFYAFTKGIADAGHRPSTRVIECGEEKPSQGLRKSLGLLPDEGVTRVCRLRLVDDEPIILETSYVPLACCPGLVNLDLTGHGLYEVMAEHYGIYVHEAEEYFEPVAADEFEARFLGVPPGAPALLLSRLAWDPERRPIELTKAIVRGDRCRYWVTLPRE